VGQGGVPAFNTLFRGRRVDLFGGVEWDVPQIPTPFGGITGLRVKLEYSADALRDELANLGVLIDDSRDGQRWRLAGPQA
jgi:hypothetical protein